VIAAERLDAVDSLAAFNVVGWRVGSLGATLAEAAGGAEPGRRELERLAGRFAPLLPALGGSSVPPRLTILRSRTEGNLERSIEAFLEDQGRLTFGCSNFLANGPSGFEPATDHTFDARANWWGDPSGPTHPDNPGGIGDPIRDAAAGGVGTVLFAPFLAGPAIPDDCPATPVVEIPALGPAGLALLALLLAGVAFGLLRRERHTPAG
jgi:hypothetical protein